MPSQIAARWPDIQRIPLVETEWSALSGDALKAKTDALRRLIVGAILPSGAAIYKKEVDDERERAERLSRMLKIVAVLLAVAAVTAAVAWWQWRTATLNQRIAEASRLDATATSLFAEAGQFDSRRDLEMNRRADIVAELAAVAPTEEATIRESNLRDEIAQTEWDLKALAADSGRLRSEGHAMLSQANAAWSALKGRTPAAATRHAPESPDVLSIELLNAGFGESILVHYGTPEDAKLVMMDWWTTEPPSRPWSNHQITRPSVWRASMVIRSLFSFSLSATVTRKRRVAFSNSSRAAPRIFEASGTTCFAGVADGPRFGERSGLGSTVCAFHQPTVRSSRHAS